MITCASANAFQALRFIDMRKLHVLNFNDIIQLILGKNFLLFWVTVRIPVSFGLLIFFLNIVNLFKKKENKGIVLSQHVYIYLERLPGKDVWELLAGSKAKLSSKTSF